MAVAATAKTFKENQQQQPTGASSSQQKQKNTAGARFGAGFSDAG